MSGDITNRRDRINQAVDSLCRGKRLEAVDRRVEAERMADAITSRVRSADDYRTIFHSFLAGWDEAMALRHDELADENHELHGIIFDLVTRMHVRRCEHCKGDGVTEDVEPCPHCDGGWIDIAGAS